MNRIKQPRWKKVEYTRSQIIRAGKTIKNQNSTPQEKELALKVIDNWREAHAYPLQVIYVHLKNMAQSNKKIIVAQRLKRLESIIKKLEREPSMSLWTIQDLGGCRFIVDSIEDVYKYYDKYRNSRIRHRYIKEYDYIESPKKSGYRSLHVVYEYHSDKVDTYNKNMLIEIQFRTHLQHLWATAVETMGLFTKEAIKSGQGSDDVKRFFVLVSALFAIKEETSMVPNVANDLNEIISEIEALNAKNNYLDFLGGIKVAVDKQYDNDPKGDAEYYILKLNYNTKRLIIKRYNRKQSNIATETYNQIEREKGEENIDAVLVRVDSFKVLKKAYPNYFSDIGEFIKIVKSYLS